MDDSSCVVDSTGTGAAETVWIIVTTAELSTVTVVGGALSGTTFVISTVTAGGDDTDGVSVM